MTNKGRKYRRQMFTNPDGQKVAIKLIYDEHGSLPDFDAIPSATFGSGVEVYGYTRVRSSTYIGNDVKLGDTLIMDDAKIGDGCDVRGTEDHSITTVSAGSVMGPRSKLRGNIGVMNMIVIPTIIGADCEITGTLVGTVGDVSKVHIREGTNFNYVVDVAGYCTVDIEHGLKPQEKQHKLIVEEHAQVFLGELKGDVTIGTAAYVGRHEDGKAIVRCDVDSVEIPRLIDIGVACKLGPASLIFCDNGHSIVIDEVGRLVYDPDQVESLGEDTLLALAHYAYKQRVEAAQALRHEKSRRKALSEKVAAFAKDVQSDLLGEGRLH